MRKIVHESSEDYLEAILMLSEEKTYVRSVDIANELGFKKSSVSIAMKHLREQGHIYVDDSLHIHLTESGLEIATMIYERHKTLTKLLTDLGVDSETAEEDACKIEHVISQESFEAIKKLANFKNDN